jgi:hypothetical protein
MPRGGRGCAVDSRDFARYTRASAVHRVAPSLTLTSKADAISGDHARGKNDDRRGKTDDESRRFPPWIGRAEQPTVAQRMQRSALQLGPRRAMVADLGKLRPLFGSPLIE